MDYVVQNQVGASNYWGLQFAGYVGTIADGRVCSLWTARNHMLELWYVVSHTEQEGFGAEEGVWQNRVTALAGAAKIAAEFGLHDTRDAQVIEVGMEVREPVLTPSEMTGMFQAMCQRMVDEAAKPWEPLRAPGLPVAAEPTLPAPVSRAPMDAVPDFVTTTLIAGTTLRIDVMTRYRVLNGKRGRPANPLLFQSGHSIALHDAKRCYELAIQEHLQAFWPGCDDKLLHYSLDQSADAKTMTWLIETERPQFITVEGLNYMEQDAA